MGQCEITNLEILKPLLYFEDDWYVRVDLITRHKDGNLQQRRILQKGFFFGTYQSLEEEINNLVSLANEYNARVYIDLVSYRLSTGFLRQTEWKRNYVYGLKPNLEKQLEVPDFYSLYDADDNCKETNEFVKSLMSQLNFKPIIIKSSKKGEHWLLKRSEMEQLLPLVAPNDRHRFFLSYAWACLYNPYASK